MPVVLQDTQSTFNGTIQVVMMFGRIGLFVNGIEQTGSFTDKMFKEGVRALGHRFFGSVTHVLMYGLGGGGFVRVVQKTYPDADVDAVEIDPSIIAISKSAFKISIDSRVRIIKADAGSYAKKHKTPRYDLVFIDLYKGNTVPFFVSTKRFLSDVKKQISPGGALLFNYFDENPESGHSHRISDILHALFSSVYPAKIRSNIFFVCT